MADWLRMVPDPHSVPAQVPDPDWVRRDAVAGRLACRAPAFRRAEAQPSDALGLATVAVQHTRDVVRSAEQLTDAPAPLDGGVQQQPASLLLGLRRWKRLPRRFRRTFELQLWA